MRIFSFLFAVIRAVFMLAIALVLFGIFSMIMSDRNPNGNIAVVEVKETIEDSADIVKEIKKYREDSKVKAIILRVDSPGGAVGASQEIYDEVIKTKAIKPVIASFENVAASGGYYISVGASKIVANPGSITGSIGVITEFFMVDEILKKFNLKWEVLKSGAIKDIGSPLRPMTPEEKKIIQNMISDVYDQFVTAVSEGRGIKKEKVKEFADGRIFSGRQAKELGLVDELGGMEKAIEIAASEAKLSEKPDVIYPSKDKYKFLDKFQSKLSMPNFFKMEYKLTP